MNEPYRVEPDDKGEPALSIACRVCRAGAGQPCRYPTVDGFGDEYANSLVHIARKDARDTARASP